jgi:ABC-type sugar transport system permease subunit
MKHKWIRLSLTKRRDLKGYIFVLPLILGLMLFFAYPISQSFQYAFGKINIDPVKGAVVTNVGWDNFDYVFRRNTSYLKDFSDSFTNMLRDLPLVMIFSIIAALLLNRKFKGRAFARAVFFLPVIITSGVLLGFENKSLQMMISKGVSQEMGNVAAVASNALRQVLGDIQFDQTFISYILVAVDSIYSIINYSGMQILIYLAALHQISDELKEAAHIDGATGWEFYWKVTLPITSPYLIVIAVYTVIDSLTRANNVLMTRIEDLTFRLFEVNTAAALSWSYFALVFVFLVILLGLMNKVTFYDE